MSKMLFALAALAVATTAPAFASIPHTAGTRIVNYADLDLSSASGRARLEQRIDSAVRTICGSTTSADLRGASEVRACRVATLALVSRPVSASGGTQ